MIDVEGIDDVINKRRTDWHNDIEKDMRDVYEVIGMLDHVASQRDDYMMYKHLVRTLLRKKYSTTFIVIGEAESSITGSVPTNSTLINSEHQTDLIQATRPVLYNRVEMLVFENDQLQKERVDRLKNVQPHALIYAIDLLVTTGQVKASVMDSIISHYNRFTPDELKQIQDARTA